MASIVLSSVGSSIGSAILGNVGGHVGAFLGKQLGASLDEDMGLRDGSSPRDGARLESLRVQDSRYGIGIPLVYGQARLAGNVIWASPLIESAHHEKVGGGKGGGVTSSAASRTTYSYSLHCAIALCAGPIGGIATIWADSKVIYQNDVWAAGVVANANIHLGDDNQPVDPFLESMIGSGAVPAYRGVAYVVLESLQLGNFGNRLPNLTFEIMPAATQGEPAWKGSLAPTLKMGISAARNHGLQPIRIEGGSLATRRLLVGGYHTGSSTARFVIEDYDVTGDTPRLLNQVESADFALQSAGSQAWIAEDEGRFLVMAMTDSKTSPCDNFVVFDTQTQTFGTVLTLPRAVDSGPMILAWLDEFRFAMAVIENGVRGLRVFTRAGLHVVDMGFFPVWGDGSQSAYWLLDGAQFTKTADGSLATFAMTGSITNATLWVRVVRWAEDGFSCGAAFAIATNLNFTDSYGLGYFIPCGDAQYVLFRASRSGMRLLSFQIYSDHAVVTRPFQKIANASFWELICAQASRLGDKLVVVQRSGWDNMYRVSEIALREADFALTKDGAAAMNFEDAAQDFGAVPLDAARFFVFGAGGAAQNLAHVGILKTHDRGASLDRIVGDVLRRAGLSDQDYDVSDLQSVFVDGYVLDHVMSGGSALAPLRVFHAFDLVEAGGILRAVSHRETPNAVLDKGEILVRTETAQKREGVWSSWMRTRVRDADLPVGLTLDYLDPARDYEVGTQRARRAVDRGGSVAKIVLPLVCSAEKAKGLAQARLYKVWNEREAVKFRLDRSWLVLEAGDIVAIHDLVLRLTRVRDIERQVEVEAVIVPRMAALSSIADDVADGGVFEREGDKGTISTSATRLYLMDLPLLSSNDDQAGIYVAVGGGALWKGAEVWRGVNAVDDVRVARFDVAATCGICVQAMGVCRADYPDRISKLRVRLLRGSLASCAWEDVLNGANAALIGDEIVQFQNAVLVEPDLVELSVFLRGRKGSLVTAHEVGERFVFLDENAVRFLPLSLADRDVPLRFRAVSSGQSLGQSLAVTQSFALNVLRPLSPVHVKATRASGDLVLSWVRRARKNAAWLDYSDVPLDQSAELYDVEILKDGQVVRVFADVATSRVVYDLAAQTADWGGAAPLDLAVRVYQKGDGYGRGDSSS